MWVRLNKRRPRCTYNAQTSGWLTLADRIRFPLSLMVLGPSFPSFLNAMAAKLPKHDDRLNVWMDGQHRDSGAELTEVGRVTDGVSYFVEPLRRKNDGHQVGIWMLLILQRTNNEWNECTKRWIINLRVLFWGNDSKLHIISKREDKKID